MLKSFFVLILAFPLFSMASVQEDACVDKKNKAMEIEAISSNIANIETSRTPEGGPYRRKILSCRGSQCQVVERSKTLLKYLPQHPDADQHGYVKMPDINLNHELAQMIKVQKDYDLAVASCYN